MFFYSYIQEIKIRLIYVVLSFLITFLSLYIYSNILLEFLINNLLSIKNNSLIFTTITESFMSHIRFSINFSIIISLFVFFVQLWLFLKPGLYCYENFYVKFICFIFIKTFSVKEI
jgi:Sec-independent protein secretion pathway component TatC